ncbi:MAG TPA: hypothetical protein DIT48_13540 [Actinobacteria bacterium]|nr:hypothetical protein [Actinomycetota bacterium]HCP60950.1 hypothetical protein [Actinomycetota bacterium]
MASGKLTLLLWAGGVSAMAGAATLWARFAWHRLTITAEFDPPRVFASEPVILRVRVVNDKPLPLPVVRLGIWLPPGLFPGETNGPGTIRGFHRQLSLGARSEVILELPVLVRRRGEYWLERISAEVSDPFDLSPMQRDVKPDADLLVMPEPRIQLPVEIIRKLPFGQPARASRMFDERERFAGVRPYEPGDPLNRIHWKLTGHAGGLQVKLFEPTRSADVLFALDLSVGEPFWNAIYPDIAEDTIGWASFLARQAVDNGWRIGMVANTHLSRGRGPLRVPPSSRKGHEGALFAALARMPNEPTADLCAVLREAGRRVAKDTAIVVISPRAGGRLRHEMMALRRRGMSVFELSPLKAVLEGAS